MMREIKQKIIEDTINWYISNQNIYKKLAKKIKDILEEILDLDKISYHIITSRAKDIDSLRKKIEKDKYNDPINQITDFAGIRVIAYVENDVEKICEIIKKTFDIDEPNSSDKSENLGTDKVGYKSIHYIASLKNNRLVLPEYKNFRQKQFEIQVRTILQHAWAEISHDRSYKFTGELPSNVKRKFGLLAGSLELADEAFNSISLEIDKIVKEVDIATKEDNNLDIELNSTTLKQYLTSKFSENFTDFGGDFISEESIKEIRYFGIKTLKDLDILIPKDYFIKYKKYNRYKNSTIGFIRNVLIISDYEKYFDDCWLKDWRRFSNNNVDFLKEYSVPIEKVVKKYEILLGD